MKFLRKLLGCDADHWGHHFTAVDEGGRPLGYDMATGAVLYVCERCGHRRWR